MPVFEEDPTRLSKSRLRSDLVAHSVVLPCDSSRKAVYVDLHLKHIDPRHAADFSSDEEDQVFEDTREKEKEEEPPSSGVEMRDIIGLTNDELKATLLKHGVKAGPIVASTRALYERRLAKLLHSYGPEETALNGKGDANTYSDSEEEEEEEEDDVDEGDKEVQKEESDSGDSRQEAISHLEQAPEGDKQGSLYQNEAYFYQRCFLPSPRLRARAPGPWEPSSVRNVRNAVKSPLEPASQPRGSHLPSGLSAAVSLDEPTGLDPALPQVLSTSSVSLKSKSSALSRSQDFSITQMMERDKSRLSSSPATDGERWSKSEGQGDRSRLAPPDLPEFELQTPKNEFFFYTPNASSYKQSTKEHVADGPTRFYPKTGLMPTGVAVTCRRPIKGAAGRPVQYKYPDLPPASPLTLERQGVERRLVPVYIQMVVFLAMAGLLYLVYACMEENPYNPLLPLLDGASEAMTMVMRTTESEPGPADPLDRAAQDSLSG